MPADGHSIIASPQEAAAAPAAGRLPEEVQASTRGPVLLAACGLIAFAAAVGVYIGFALSHQMPDWMQPVDLRVYRFGGLIAAHVRPWYDPHRAAPLYDWPGYIKLKFTYTPFAALLFIAATVLPLGLTEALSLAVGTVALLVTIAVTLRAIGWPGGAGRSAVIARAGAPLLIGALAFWLEPVQRTLFLGQVELILMALIMWDLCQPDRRWWKGAGVGIAAGIKLVPLIFIPYLLLTRRFRQAAVAAGVFVLTAGVGYVADPADSTRWWFGGIFLQGSRTGFIGWEGNQSLRGLLTRLAGSIAGGQWPWIGAAAVVLVAGFWAATALDRAGHPVVGVLTCALTGILVSPISWDHHWVWVVPAVTVAAGCAAAAQGRRRWGYVAVLVLLAAAFFSWPTGLWGEPNALGGFSLGPIWAPPNTSPWVYFKLGDQPWFAEYHWHGLELLVGNLYVLTGLALLVLVTVLPGIAVRSVRQRPVTQR